MGDLDWLRAEELHWDWQWSDSHLIAETSEGAAPVMPLDWFVAQMSIAGRQQSNGARVRAQGSAGEE